MPRMTMKSDKYDDFPYVIQNLNQGRSCKLMFERACKALSWDE